MVGIKLFIRKRLVVWHRFKWLKWTKKFVMSLLIMITYVETNAAHSTIFWKHWNSQRAINFQTLNKLKKMKMSLLDRQSILFCSFRTLPAFLMLIMITNVETNAAHSTIFWKHWNSQRAINFPTLNKLKKMKMSLLDRQSILSFSFWVRTLPAFLMPLAKCQATMPSFTSPPHHAGWLLSRQQSAKRRSPRIFSQHYRPAKIGEHTFLRRQ